MRVGRGGVPGRHGGERPISPASTDSDLAVRGEGSTQAGRAQLWTAWWGPDKGHRRPSLQPSPGTAQLSLSRNVASASGAAVGGWSPRRASAGESGRQLCKATSGGQVPSVPPQVRITAMFCGNSSLLHGNPGPGTPHALRGTSAAKCRARRPLCVSVPRSASLSHLLDLMWFFFVLPVTYDTLLQSPGNSPR